MNQMNQKSVICFLVDSLMPSILEKGINQKVVPAFEFLMHRGSYRMDCVTVFPTMTASIDASIITGSYPDQHKVPGLIWYDPEEEQIINYINGGKTVLKLGISSCAQNVLHHLNENHISKDVSTIFEDLGKKGYTSASINLIAHRGTHKHPIKLGPFFRWLTKMSKDVQISGPEILTLGTFTYPDFLEPDIKRFDSGLLQKYGINDSFAISVTKELIQSGQQPHFMMIYLPDNDHHLHRSSPLHGEWSLIQVDQRIQDILNCYSSWDEAIRENIFIITSDHGQTYIGQKSSIYNIDLDEILQSIRVLQLGEKVTTEHDLVVCNNERMAYLYPLNAHAQEKVIQLFKKETRVDLLAWKVKHTVQVLQPGTEKRFGFSPEGSMVDPYGKRWHIEGECSIMGITIQGTQLVFSGYPDILSRLYGALFSQEIPSMIITARPHFEFRSRFYPTHNHGGSHGSLHEIDAYVPFMISERIPADKLPRRLVEFKGFINELFSTIHSD